jgi:3-hydroxybutyrate dehydrogenase
LIADLGLRPEAEKLLERYTASPKAMFVRTDVTEWAQLERMFEVAGREFGGVDVVCPGAGICEFLPTVTPPPR